MGVHGYAVAVTASEYAAAAKEPAAAFQKTRFGREGVASLEKSWDGILWVLSADRRNGEMVDPSELVAEALLGHEQFAPGAESTGVPPGRAAEVAAALDALSESDLRANFTPDAMMEADVYPSIWDDGEEAFLYIWENFEDLRRVFREAAASGGGVLIRIG